MKKIVQLLYPGIGGVSSVVFNIVEKNQIKNNWNDFLIFSGPHISKRNKDILKDIKVDYFYNKSIKFLSFITWHKIFFKILKQKPDAILVHNFDIFPAILYKILFRKKIIYIDHFPHYGKIGNKLKLTYFFVKLFFDKLVVLNKEKLKFFKKKGFPKKKIELIPNGIKEIKNLKNKIFSKNKLIIGMSSRINNRKNHELIIDTFNSKKLRNKNIFCYLAGDGEMAKDLKNKVKNLSLNKKIFFLGNLKNNDLTKFYKKIDLYIQASKGEVLSISMLEAFNYQIPVIGSNVEGINNLLIPKRKIGILFNNNKKSLLNKIIFFYNLSYQKKLEYSKNQKKYFLKNFTSEKMFDGYKMLIEKL